MSFKFVLNIANQGAGRLGLYVFIFLVVNEREQVKH